MNTNHPTITETTATTHEFFFRQLQKYELEALDGWKGEFRDRLIAMLNPLLGGTDYFLQKNQTDKGSNGNKRILELWEKGINKRRIGFEHKIRAVSEDKRIISWFNRQFYDELINKMVFPKMVGFKGNQPYFNWSIEGLWNLMCVIGGKTEFMTENSDDASSADHNNVQSQVNALASQKTPLDENDLIAIVREEELQNLQGKEREAIVKVQVNQSEFRERLLHRYSKCCLCGVSNPDLLTASHIKPWAESHPDEKLDIDNGFLFCPNHDKLFDKGYISFSDTGEIIISPSLSETDRLFMNIHPDTKIDLTARNKKYLAFHRENIFIH